MNPLDVRDVNGRIWRLFCSLLVGAPIAVLIAAVLPQRSLCGWGDGAFGFVNPVLVGIGVVAITLAVYAALGAIARMPPRIRVRVPRAVVVRRRF